MSYLHSLCHCLLLFVYIRIGYQITCYALQKGFVLIIQIIIYSLTTLLVTLQTNT